MMKYTTTMSTAKSVALVITLNACGGGAASPDASVPEADSGRCGNMLQFVGEYVDWDSGDAFCGVFGATFQPQGTDIKSVTAPNGRFDLCLPQQAVVLVDIVPPTGPSQCTAQAESYTLPGLAVANKEVLTAGGNWSGRAFGMTRQAIDPAKAQVFVHVSGVPREVSLAASHSTPQARVNGTWGAGSAGADVFFPDVDPSTGTTTLSAGGAIGSGDIPVVAGKMTNVTIVSN